LPGPSMKQHIGPITRSMTKMIDEALKKKKLV